MAEMLPVTQDQYDRVLAFRDACHQVAALLKTLQKAGVKHAQQLFTPLSRQATQLDDQESGVVVEMAAQKCKQTHKLIGSAFDAVAFLDHCRHEGVAGTETDIWSTIRTQGMALVELPGRPWDDKP